MATPPRPPSRLDDGRINPAYTAWRKEHALKNPADSPVLAMDSEGAGPQSTQSHEILSLKAVALVANARFVMCGLNGVKVPVRCKKGVGKKLLKKMIKVKVDRSIEPPIYTHVR